MLTTHRDQQCDAYIQGTYQGIQIKYLDSYLDEFCFYFSLCAGLFQRPFLAVALLVVGSKGFHNYLQSFLYIIYKFNH